MEESCPIKILVKNGKEIELEKQAAELSDLLKQTIIDFPDEEKFPINEVEEKEAEKIKEYLTHFNGKAPPEIEKPLTSNVMKNVTDEWSANFIDKMSLDDICSLIASANYMGIHPLIDLCSAKIASFFKDRSEEDILREYQIKEPLTEKEKNILIENNKYDFS